MRLSTNCLRDTRRYDNHDPQLLRDDYSYHHDDPLTPSLKMTCNDVMIISPTSCRSGILICDAVAPAGLYTPAETHC